MSLSLYEAVVPNWLQILGSVERLIGKAEQFCADENLAEDELLEVRLAPDMLPLGYQIKSCWTHSKLALDGARAGQFSPDMSPYPTSLSACRAVIEEARKACTAIDPDELDRIADNRVIFSIKDRFRLDFEVKNFLTSFAVPNFFFHATTTYDILRWKGVEIGKQDFLGRLRVLPS